MTRPLNIAHRGGAGLRPENTLAAFSRALDDGADGIELDVRLARDGVPVVIHDGTLQRTGLTPDQVARMTSDELARIDVGMILAGELAVRRANLLVGGRLRDAQHLVVVLEFQAKGKYIASGDRLGIFLLARFDAGQTAGRSGP